MRQCAASEPATAAKASPRETSFLHAVKAPETSAVPDGGGDGVAAGLGTEVDDDVLEVVGAADATVAAEVGGDSPDPRDIAHPVPPTATRVATAAAATMARDFPLAPR